MPENSRNEGATIRGRSMEPLLFEGDIVQLTHASSAQPGKIYSFPLEDNTSAAHRLVSVDGAFLFFRGDRQPEGERVAADTPIQELVRVLHRAAPPPASAILFGLAALCARSGELSAPAGATLLWPWPQLLALAQRHRLLSVLGYMLKRTGLSQEAPAEVKASLWAAMAQDMERAEQISTAIASALAAVPRARFLKGAELRRLYPEDYLRTMGDIDLLVPEESYHQALAKLAESGFHWNASSRAKAEFYHQATVHHEGTDMPIEVHSTLFQTHRFRFNSRPFAQGSETRAELLAYLAAHAVSHWGTHGISMLDIFLLLEADPPAEEALAEAAAENGCLPAMCFVLAGIREWWNRPYGEGMEKGLTRSQRLRQWVAREFFLHRFDLEADGRPRLFLQFLLADSMRQFFLLFLEPGRRRLHQPDPLEESEA